ncbi:MAG: hypothetical protein ABFS03_14085 [Chloroflexota bacterium]
MPACDGKGAADFSNGGRLRILLPDLPQGVDLSCVAGRKIGGKEYQWNEWQYV